MVIKNLQNSSITRNLIGVFNPSKWTNADMCRIHGVTYETLMEDQENQIHGFVHYTDAAGMCLQQLTLFTPREAVRIVKNGEVNLKYQFFNYSIFYSFMYIYIHNYCQLSQYKIYS